MRSGSNATESFRTQALRLIRLAEYCSCQTQIRFLTRTSRKRTYSTSLLMTPEAHKFVQLARERYDIYHEYRKTGAREVYISDADRQRIFVIEEAMRQILSRIF